MFTAQQVTVPLAPGQYSPDWYLGMSCGVAGALTVSGTAIILLNIEKKRHPRR